MSLSNEYIGLYFYSAIFQGNMALLALLGVFVVFKRQEIMNELQGKDAAIVNFIQNYADGITREGFHVPLTYKHVPDLKERLVEMSIDTARSQNLREGLRQLLGNEKFLSRFTEREQLILKRQQLLSDLTNPFRWILAIIIASLILMPFANWINKNGCGEIPLIGAIALSNTYALYLIKKYVWKALAD